MTPTNTAASAVSEATSPALPPSYYVPGTQPFVGDIAIHDGGVFAAAFLLSMPPAVQAAMTADPWVPLTQSQINALVQASPIPLLLDAVNGWNITNVFAVAIEQGWAWLPSINQPAVTPPGIPQGDSTLVPYTPTPPAGAVIIPQWNAQGYLIPPAPFTAPVAPAPPTNATVGDFAFMETVVNAQGVAVPQYYYNPKSSNANNTVTGLVAGMQLVQNGILYQTVAFPIIAFGQPGSFTYYWLDMGPASSSNTAI